MTTKCATDTDCASSQYCKHPGQTAGLPGSPETGADDAHGVPDGSGADAADGPDAADGGDGFDMDVKDGGECSCIA